MAHNRITLELVGLPTIDGRIRLSDLLGALQQFRTALGQADIVASGARTADLRVVALSYSSPAQITVETVPYDRTNDRTEAITETFFAASRHEIRAPESENSRLLVNAFESLAGMVGKGVAAARLKNGTHRVELNQEFKLEAQKAISPQRTVHGSVRGRLEAINFHGGANTFWIYPFVGPKKVVCRFAEELSDKALASVKQRAIVKGSLHYKEGARFPHAIDVTDLDLLPPDSVLPTLSQLRGIAPDATGDLSSEDFIRQLRDGWQE
jgi:hypothetical protein